MFGKKDWWEGGGEGAVVVTLVNERFDYHSLIFFTSLIFI